MKDLLHRSPRHLLGTLADEFEDAAVAHGWDVDLFLAMALRRAIDTDPDDHHIAHGDLAAWIDGVRRAADDADAETARGVREAAAGAARDATDRAGTGQHEALPAGELEPLAADLAAVQWKLLAPTGWPVPPNLPAGVTFAEPSPGFPPVPRKGWYAYCPHCGHTYRQMTWLKKHLRTAHGWPARPDGELLPPASHDQGHGRRRAA